MSRRHTAPIRKRSKSVSRAVSANRVAGKRLATSRGANQLDQPSLDHSNQSKAIAILCVVFIHCLAIVPGLYTISPRAWWWIHLDQLARLCVPVFIALSGYGLAISQQRKSLSLIQFFLRRVLKLLPLYILWTCVFIFIFTNTRAWTGGGDGRIPTLWPIFVFGGGDYHLYFIPLIFQLYLLFPLLRWCVSKAPIVSLILAFAVQVTTLYMFTDPFMRHLPQFFWNDSGQYLFPLSWIGYFVLGIVLVEKPVKRSKFWLFFPAALIGLWLTSRSVELQLARGIDPLFALKFTRVELVPYATAIILTLFAGLRLQGVAGKALAFIGKWSLLIYFSHTIVLRLYYSVWKNVLSPTQYVWISAVWLLAVVVSVKLSRKV